MANEVTLLRDYEWFHSDARSKYFKAIGMKSKDIKMIENMDSPNKQTVKVKVDGEGEDAYLYHKFVDPIYEENKKRFQEEYNQHFFETKDYTDYEISTVREKMGKKASVRKKILSSKKKRQKKK